LKIRTTDTQCNTHIQSLCDWYISDTFNGDINIQPKNVFVKVEFIIKFYNMHYKKIKKSSKFILITGFSDKTIPNQVDQRFSIDEPQNIIIKNTKQK
jgi:hypothetical protein